MASHVALPVELKPVEAYPAWATKRVYEGRIAVPGSPSRVMLDLGRVRDWATVFVDDVKAAELWCEPYSFDVAPFLKNGAADIRVEVTSTWYNALVHDASLPEGERTTWTIKGPKVGSLYRDAGLLGPANLLYSTQKETRQ